MHCAFTMCLNCVTSFVLVYQARPQEQQADTTQPTCVMGHSTQGCECALGCSCYSRIAQLYISHNMALSLQAMHVLILVYSIILSGYNLQTMKRKKRGGSRHCGRDPLEEVVQEDFTAVAAEGLSQSLQNLEIL